MEYHWSSLINNSKSSSSSTTSTTADYNTPTFNNGHHAWDSFNNAGNFSRPAEQANWSYPLHYINNSVSYYSNPSAARPVVEVGAAAYQAVALREHAQEKMGGGASSAANRCYQLDPHLTCLKLGKRQYFEDVMVAAAAPPPPAAAATTKKGKPYYAVDGVQNAVQRCQVEGCGVVLVNAKEYHRRHKVCEMHAKAPVVVVLGIQQRFCQQCSRFHRVAEFDETKRSCRRRLAGHNERRRKTSLLDNQHHHYSHKLSLMQGIRRHDDHDGVINNNNIRGGESCALSLLSSTNNYSWTNLNTATSASHLLPETCSAALRDLIAENRASTSAFNKKHLITDYPNNHNNNNQMDDYYYYTINNRAGSNPHGNGAGHVTLDLMEAQNSELGFISTKERDEQQECSELWKVPLGYR